jgi:DNA polymerase IIIc chi subunit
MVLQEKTQNSLQQRINVYLHGEYIVEDSQDEAVVVLFDMLQQAEENLEAAQERVDRLKSELAKVPS